MEQRNDGRISPIAAQTDDGEAARRAAQKLWTLLKARAERYAMGDHSSLPTALMEELLRSIVFTLEQGGCRGEAVATADLDEAFASGRARIDAQTEAAKRLWETVCAGAPAGFSRAYRDTLASIGGFFQRYDRDYFAHEIPCDIDYQLSYPAAEGKLGVAYIAAYLEQLHLENTLLRGFDAALTQRLLTAWQRDYRASVANLCEPVTTNALGLALLGENVRELNVSAAQTERLSALFLPLCEREAREKLAEAARRFCRAAGVDDPLARARVGWLAGELYPRIAVAAAHKNLGGIFLAFA